MLLLPGTPPPAVAVEFDAAFNCVAGCLPAGRTSMIAVLDVSSHNDPDEQPLGQVRAAIADDYRATRARQACRAGRRKGRYHVADAGGADVTTPGADWCRGTVQCTPGPSDVFSLCVPEDFSLHCGYTAGAGTPGDNRQVDQLASVTAGHRLSVSVQWGRPLHPAAAKARSGQRTRTHVAKRIVLHGASPPPPSELGI